MKFVFHDWLNPASITVYQYVGKMCINEIYIIESDFIQILVMYLQYKEIIFDELITYLNSYKMLILSKCISNKKTIMKIDRIDLGIPMFNIYVIIYSHRSRKILFIF